MKFAWRTETMVLPDHKVGITERSQGLYTMEAKITGDLFFFLNQWLREVNGPPTFLIALHAQFRFLDSIFSVNFKYSIRILYSKYTANY